MGWSRRTEAESSIIRYRHKIAANENKDAREAGAKIDAYVSGNYAIPVRANLFVIIQL